MNHLDQKEFELTTDKVGTEFNGLDCDFMVCNH